MIRYDRDDDSPDQPARQAAAGASQDTSGGFDEEPTAGASRTPDTLESASSAGSVPVEAAVRQRDEYYDLLLRKTAEFDNYRKRTERERRDRSDHATADLIKELLPVLDDFSRALQAGAEGEGLRQGVELIHRRLLDALTRRGLSIVDPVGETFDPHLHEAVMRVPAEGLRDGEVVEVFALGYKLGDRLLRPAMVKVATA